MKSQQLSFASLSSIDSEDIKALRDLTNNMNATEDYPTPSYIKYLRLDCFMVSLYCNSQLESFLQCKDRLISIDATGNVVKKQDNTRTFYYAAVYRSELTGAIIPLMEFFANRHDIASLSDILTCFNRYLKIFSGSKC